MSARGRQPEAVGHERSWRGGPDGPCRPSTLGLRGRGVCHPSPIASADQITLPPLPADEAEDRPARPSVAEVRAVGQPPGLLDRSCESWGGRLYMRRISPYVTRALLRTPVTANGATWLMTVCGLLAAAVVTLPGLLAAAATVLLIQAQLLFDCVDGELARWRRRRSPAGIYLDRIAHYVTESVLPIAIGIRADGGWDQLGTWTFLGFAGGFLILFVKAESALVAVARAEGGRPPLRDAPEAMAPRHAGLRTVRRGFGLVPIFKLWAAVELSLLVLAAAAVDAAAGDLVGSKTLVVALLAAGAVTAVGHLVAILASDRLR
jgi:phosphatidylglycerophosphate synthase